MKKMRKLLLGLIMLMSISAFAQTPELTWEMRNPHIVSGAADSLQFEVWVKADMTGFFFSLHTFAMDYPADRFGSNAWDNDPTISRMSVQRGALLTTMFSGVYQYNVLGTANTFPNTFSASIQSNFNAFDPNAMFHTEMPTTFGHFFTITIEILDNGGVADIDFAEWLMNGQQFYHIGGGPTSAEACIDPNLYTPGNPLLLYPLGGGGGAMTWTGVTNGDWFTGTNWDSGNAPTATDDVSVPAGTPNDPDIYFTLSNDATCQNLDKDAGARLRIGNLANLTVNGTLTNNGEMIMYGTDRGASLREMGIGGTGTFVYERTLAPGPDMDPAGWHMVSSPVNNTKTGDFMAYWVNEYVEAGYPNPDDPTETWYYNPIDPWPGDCMGSNFDTPMQAGQGFSVKQFVGYPDFCGTGVTGDVIEFGGDFMSTPECLWPTDLTDPALMANVITGSFTLNLTATASGPDEYYNLIGNPYPSALDWDMVTIPAGMNGAIYYYDDAPAQDWVEYNLNLSQVACIQITVLI
jgi:hypothetical protein